MNRTGLAALGLAAAALTACSNSEPSGQQITPGSSTSGSSKATTAPTTPTRTAQTLAQRLQAAGLACPSSDFRAKVKCIYNGEDVTVTTDSWIGTADLRRQACSQGYVNKSYKVVTDEDRLTLAPDQNATTAKLAQLLGLKVVNYCP